MTIKGFQKSNTIEIMKSRTFNGTTVEVLLKMKGIYKELEARELFKMQSQEDISKLF